MSLEDERRSGRNLNHGTHLHCSQAGKSLCHQCDVRTELAIFGLGRESGERTEGRPGLVN